MNISQTKQKVLLIAVLAGIVWILQSIVLKLNLQYGFRDGDWYIIRAYTSLTPPSIDHLISGFKLHGVYAYQIYYVGFLTEIFGLDFKSLYLANHFFKFLASFMVFFMILVITRKKITAFLSFLIYSIAYPVSGALFMFLTGAYFIAIICLNFFFISYWVILNQDVVKYRWILLSSILFISTILLNPERMFPLVPLVLIIELLWVIRSKWTKLGLKLSLVRVLVFMLPLVVFYVAYSLWLKSQVNAAYFTPQFIMQVGMRSQSIIMGNWQLLLYPFASFGSLFLYGDFWKFFGNFDTSSFMNFISYFIFRPLAIFFIPTFFIMCLISKKPLKSILITLVPVFVFGFVIFIMTKNWSNIDPTIRIHFDPSFVGIPALFGFYILSLSFSLFLIWLKTDNKQNLLALIFTGSFASFLFVCFTWIGSDVQLLFMGPQRYLTAPAIGSSLFLAGLITLIYSQLKKNKLTEKLTWVSLFLIIPIILINVQVNKEFFDYELNVVGMDGVEQTRIKNKFWFLAPSISTTEASLFYFDETKDNQNGYFDESTIMAGFEDWIQFDLGKLLVVNRPNPGMMRTNIQCPEHTHENCMKILKEGFVIINGEKGIWYKDIIRSNHARFYKLSNFYALRFINKDLVDIRVEVLREITE